MKLFFTTLIFIFIVSVSSAQFTDLYWPIGRNCGLDFRTSPVTVNLTDSNKNSTMDNTSTSICDRAGQIIFYSNALRVFNKNGHVMPNGSGFNVGTLSNSYATSGSYNPTLKGAVIIPFPNDTNKFYMFYSNLEWNVTGNYLPEKLFYLTLDRNLDNGLGDVVLKDQVVISNDTLTFGEIMAVKHGNGKDWWVLCRKYKSGIFYKLLVDSSGVHSIQSQTLPVNYADINADMLTYIPNISMNGEHLAYIYAGDTESSLELLDFNRCTGTLSNYKSHNWHSIHTNSYLRSCCFSPNDRYLYVSDWDSIWQTDLQASNLVNSAVYLGYKHPFSELFLMKNAPDGKIYISHYGSWQHISIIEHPNVQGTACNYLLDTIHFGSQLAGPWADGGLPNVPNFNLGKLNCDVGIQATAVNKNELLIYPNPASQSIVISNKSLVNTIEITDLLGRVCIIPPLQRGLGGLEINIEGFPNGIYFLKATDEFGNITNTKFVKQ